jgi:hypothetical protein
MEGEVAPSSQLSVRYSLHVPAEAPPRTYHCAIGFTGLADPRATQQTGRVGIVTAIRIVSTLYVTVGNSVPSGVIKKIALEKVVGARTAGYRAIFSVENSGLTNLRGIGKIEIIAADGKTVETLDFPTIVILPQRTQRIPVVLMKILAEGDYTIRVRANIGTGEIQEASLAFHFPLDIPPPDVKPAVPGVSPVPMSNPLPDKP